MKTKNILQIGIITSMLILLLSSCKSPASIDGTYETILTSANSTGKYMLLCIDGNKYELLEKYITRPEMFITRGEIKGNGRNGILHLDNQMQLTIHNQSLCFQNIPLRQISQEKKLPKSYTTQIFKEDTSGEDAIVHLYTQQGERHADILFMGKTHRLKHSSSNGNNEKYMNSEDSYLICNESLENISFHVAGNMYTFTRLTPSYCTYKSQSPKNDHIPPLIDAIYYNDGEQAFVKLITNDINHCYTLPQQEASAKTAIYSNEKAEWQFGNQQNASLLLDGEKYKYQEL